MHLGLFYGSRAGFNDCREQLNTAGRRYVLSDLPGWTGTSSARQTFAWVALITGPFSAVVRLRGLGRYGASTCWR